MRFGLRARLIAAFAFSSVVTIALAGWLAIGHSYDALKRQKQQDELAIARNVAVQIDGLLSRAGQTIRNLAAQSDIVGMNPARQRSAMTIVAGVSALIDNLIVTDLHGRVVVTDALSSNARRVLPDSPLETFVRPVLAARGVSRRVYKSVTGQVVVAISAPILKDGRILGVITAGVLTTNDNFGYIENIRIGKSGYAYVVDESGRVIVHPRHELLFEDFRAYPAVAGLLKRAEGVAEYLDGDRVPVLAAYAPLSKADWGVVVCQTTLESYVHAERLYYFLLLVFVGSLAAAIAGGALMAWRLSEPIGALAQGARAVADGRLETRVAVTSSDEIGDLAAAFNTMTSRLRQTLAAEKLAVVGQLAAGLAHEIQNPLTVISGFADYLRAKTPEDDPRRSALDDIGRESKRCQRLIGQLLDFARPRALQRESSSVNALVRDVAGLMAPQAGTQGVEVVLDLDATVPEVGIDRDQMKQVLINLCLNACQAMPRGGRLRLSTARKEAKVEIAVADSGDGIADADLPRLFSPFFTTKPTGTGLGLATSSAIVQNHEGEIGARSRPGEGAVFTVSLPIPGGINAKGI